LILQIVGNIV